MDEDLFPSESFFELGDSVHGIFAEKVSFMFTSSVIADFEALVKLKSQSDSKNELANLDFSTPTLNVKPKKLPLSVKLPLSAQDTEWYENIAEFTEW